MIWKYVQIRWYVSDIAGKWIYIACMKMNWVAVFFLLVAAAVAVALEHIHFWFTEVDLCGIFKYAWIITFLKYEF